MAELGEHIRKQPANVDETSWRERGKRAWLWVVVTPLVTVFHVAATRCGKVARRLLGSAYGQVVTSDRWKAYNPFRRRQLCWAHLRRDFQAMVDRQNGGSPDLVMGYEDIAPGAEIQLHRHLVADEILFVHRGSGTASLNGRTARVTAGATIYIPRNVTVGLVNDGNEPLGVTFTFSKPGFEELMRDNSVPEGQPVTPMSAEERAKIQAKQRWHTIAGPPAP